MKNKSLKRFGIVLTASILLISLVGCSKTPSVVTYSSEKVTSEQVSESTKTSEKEKESEKPSEVAEEGGLQIEYVFLSEQEKDIKVDIPTQIEKNGKTYVYTGNAEYKISETMEVVETTVEIQVEEKADLDRAISFKSGNTGKTYLLKADDGTILWGEPVKIVKKVTEKVEWGPRLDTPSIPGQKGIKYFNKYTNQEETVVGTLVRKHSSEPFWSKAEEPITGTFARIEGDSDTYGTTLWVGENRYQVKTDIHGQHPSWEGYQDDVIKILGLDASQYRVTGAGWAAEPYWGVEYVPELGCNAAVEYRDAVYPFEALCRTFYAEYEAEGESLGYKTNVTYYATVADLLKKYDRKDIEKDISKIYKVTATATYKEK